MEELKDHSLSLSMEHHFEMIPHAFFQEIPKIRKNRSFHSLKLTKIPFEKSFFKHKSCPFLILTPNKTEIQPPSPNYRKNTDEIDDMEKKITFFSQNSCHLTSFIANKTGKNSEILQKNPAENMGFDLSFNQNGQEENKENESHHQITPPNLSDMNHDISNVGDERMPYNNLNNPALGRPEPQIEQIVRSQVENEENQGLNSEDFEKIYRYSLKLFIYKTIKNHFFAHTFMFMVILMFLYDLDYGFVLMSIWISDFFNFLYYGYKIYLSKQFYKYVKKSSLIF